MQPVQDLTVESRVSRTQYQYSLEDPDLDELNIWTPKLVDALSMLPELRDVSSDQQDKGLQGPREHRPLYGLPAWNHAPVNRRHSL